MIPDELIYEAVPNEKFDVKADIIISETKTLYNIKNRKNNT